MPGLQQRLSGGKTPCVVRQCRTEPTPPQTPTGRYACIPRNVTQTNEVSVGGVNHEARDPNPSLQSSALSVPERADFQRTSSRTTIQPVPRSSDGSMERNTSAFLQVNGSMSNAQLEPLSTRYSNDSLDISPPSTSRDGPFLPWQSDSRGEAESLLPWQNVHEHAVNDWFALLSRQNQTRNDI